MRSAALTAVVALAVAACAPRSVAPAPAPVSGANQSYSPPQHHHAVPRPEHKPAPPPPLTLNAPVPTAPALQSLVGLAQSAAIERLGPPSTIDSEPPAKVWRYKTASCELDLYFYLDLRSGQMRTLHYALKGDTGDRTKQEQCLRAIAVNRNPPLSD